MSDTIVFEVHNYFRYAEILFSVAYCSYWDDNLKFWQARGVYCWAYSGQLSCVTFQYERVRYYWADSCQIYE